MKKNILLIAIFAMSIGLVSCYKVPYIPQETAASSGSIAQPPLQLPPEVEQPKYIYGGMKYQDPFLQLDKGNVVIVQRDLSKVGIDPSILLFKGFIKQSNKTIALLSDSGGNTYFVKDSKLVDLKGRVIPGVIGILKDESIVIQTDDGTTREIKLYE